MKILALSPFEPDSISGNSVTLRRVRKTLVARGHEFEIVMVSPDTKAPDIEVLVTKSRPDVLHFYHAYRTGRLLPSLAATPSVVTVSGTDLNQDYEIRERREKIDRALAGAGAIVTYNASLAGRVPGALVIPKGVTLGDQAIDLRGTAGLDKAASVFFQAGGVRPVKNNLQAIDALAPLRKEGALVIAGPILDAGYGHALAARLAREPWVRHLPLVPPDAMASAYRACDVFLNTSLSEGISNALMEAMACGCAILASDIPGNRDLLTHQETAALYRDAGELADLGAWLLHDRLAREKLGARAKQFAAERFSTEREADALLAAYERACR